MVPDLADAVMEQTSVSFVSPRGASKGGALDMAEFRSIKDLFRDPLIIALVLVGITGVLAAVVGSLRSNYQGSQESAQQISRVRSRCPPTPNPNPRSRTLKHRLSRSQAPNCPLSESCGTLATGLQKLGIVLLGFHLLSLALGFLCPWSHL